jgi:hypothetical protein
MKNGFGMFLPYSLHFDELELASDTKVENAVLIHWIQPRELRPVGKFHRKRDQLRPLLFHLLLLFRLLLLL